MPTINEPLFMMRKMDDQEEWEIFRNFHGDIAVFETAEELVSTIYFGTCAGMELAILSCYEDSCFFIQVADTRIPR